MSERKEKAKYAQPQFTLAMLIVDFVELVCGFCSSKSLFAKDHVMVFSERWFEFFVGSGDHILLPPFNLFSTPPPLFPYSTLSLYSIYLNITSTSASSGMETTAYRPFGLVWRMSSLYAKHFLRALCGLHLLERHRRRYIRLQWKRGFPASPTSRSSVSLQLVQQLGQTLRHDRVEARDLLYTCMLSHRPHEIWSLIIDESLKRSALS